MGRFQIRRLLGEGAFGRVYEAYDPQLDRMVALKVAKPERLTDAGRVERFLREARAAANLRHPNIVPVFDSGHDGPHYYIASAFVPGMTLEGALAEGALDGRKAAALTRQLAEALAYAHSRGVVHRDVKPANVLLDERGDPLLADFGLAARDSVDDRLTREGGWVGTPAYLAPEQAAGEAIAASDQYSLGCVLYELLTGQTPFAGPPEVVVYLHGAEEPPAPRQVNRAISRDLETIALKCLRKQPGERYRDCQALADDLRRWLEGEPITARRMSLAERAVRWVRREPKLAGAAAAVLLLLAAITGQSVWAAATERRLTKEAVESANEADYRFNQAGQAVDDYLHRITEDDRLKSPSLALLRRELLSDGLRYYEDFLSKRSDDAKLRRREANAYLRQAFIHHEMGNVSKAEEAFKEAIDRYGEILQESPVDSSVEIDLASAYIRKGKMEAGGLHTRQRAEASYQQALEVLKAVQGREPENHTAKALTAQVYSNLSRWVKPTNPREARRYCELALQLQREVAAARPDDRGVSRDLARLYTDLGGLQTEERQLLPGLKSYEAARQIWSKITDKDKRDREALEAESRNLQRVAINEHQLGRLAQAEKSRRESMSLQEALLYSEHSANLIDLARVYLDLGTQLASRGNRTEGINLIELSCLHQERLVRVNPNTNLLYRELADSYTNLAKVYSDHALAENDKLPKERKAMKPEQFLELHDKSLRALRRGREVLQQLPAEQQATPEILRCQALNRHQTGIILVRAKQFARARDEFRHALEVRERLVADNPKYLQHQCELLETVSSIGDAYLQEGQPAEANRWFGDACDRAAAFVAKAANDHALQSLRGALLHNRGMGELRLKKVDLATRSFGEAVAAQRRAHELAPAMAA